MDLKAIRERLVATAEKTVESPSLGSITMRRLPPTEAVGFSRRVAGLDLDEVRDQCEYKAAMIAFSVFDQDGSKPLETEEGREVLAMLPAGELSDLFVKANELNGFVTIKKASEKN